MGEVEEGGRGRCKAEGVIRRRGKFRRKGSAEAADGTGSGPGVPAPLALRVRKATVRRRGLLEQWASRDGRGRWGPARGASRMRAIDKQAGRRPSDQATKRPDAGVGRGTGAANSSGPNGSMGCEIAGADQAVGGGQQACRVDARPCTLAGGRGTPAAEGQSGGAEGRDAAEGAAQEKCRQRSMTMSAASCFWRRRGFCATQRWRGEGGREG